jgi:dihydrofolate reductase
MRDLIVACDVTVDGFMAGPDNDLDFMVHDDAVDQTVMREELTARADTIVVGRTSFHPMAEYWTTSTDAIAGWMNSTPKVVLSNTLDDVSKWPNSTLATGDGAQAVKRLKDGPGQALVVFGGVQTVASLVAAGVVDEFWLKVNPVAIGRGGAVFGGLAERRSLTLLSARTFSSGIVTLVYRAAAPGGG